jgi:hypothetical protein
MQQLPYFCKCPISNQEKWRRYYELSLRECKLVEAVMNGFKPKILIYLESVDKVFPPKNIGIFEYEAEVEKVEDFWYKVYVKNFELEYDANVTLILCDAENKPLFRRRFFFEKGSTLDIVWHIGVQESDFIWEIEEEKKSIRRVQKCSK